MKVLFAVPLWIACQACCGSAWTARVCASNASGNCRAVDNGLPHAYLVKSSSVGPLHGTTDVAVHDPSCPGGIGEVDVNVIDRDDVQVTLYCLTDAPTGKMTLTPAPPADTSVPPPPPAR